MTTESEAGVSNAGFAGFALRMTLCHMVTYWIFGMAAFLLLDYKSLFESEGYALLMRPISSKWIAAGPLLPNADLTRFWNSTSTGMTPTATSPRLMMCLTWECIFISVKYRPWLLPKKFSRPVPVLKIRKRLLWKS